MKPFCPSRANPGTAAALHPKSQQYYPAFFPSPKLRWCGLDPMVNGLGREVAYSPRISLSPVSDVMRDPVPWRFAAWGRSLAVGALP
jgi:hypothetical protein